MYTINKFEDRQFMACSIPPPYNSTLPKDFQELSRIHFYLGNTPIDFMIEAVEKASLQEIEKGKIQIYFAVKEIQDYLMSTSSDISTIGSDNLDENLCFNKAFKSILNHTLEVLEGVYQNPTEKSNVNKIETMLSLAQEVKILNESLTNVGMEATKIDSLLETIKNKYQEVLKLKENYADFANLKSFESYENVAKESVIKQLKEPYNFNYAKLSKVYLNTDSWSYTLHRILDEQKEIDTVNYNFNLEESQKLKDDFLEQFKSFNRLLKNGIVNYILGTAASISTNSFYKVLDSQISAESYFNRELNYYKDNIKKGCGHVRYNKEKVKNLEENKDEYIQNKRNKKIEYNRYLTILNRQEQNILQSLDKVKETLLGVKIKSSITLEGDIQKGFVVGTFNNIDNIMLVHKDNTVNVPEAVFTMILSKKKYEKLLQKSPLCFNEIFKEHEFQKTSNFWSYGQFLQELNDTKIQEMFLGEEFNLIDKTIVQECKKQSVEY